MQKMARKAIEEQKAAELKNKVQTVKKSLEEQQHTEDRTPSVHQCFHGGRPWVTRDTHATSPKRHDQGLQLHALVTNKLNDISKVELKNDNVQSLKTRWDGSVIAMKKQPDDEILDNLFYRQLQQ